MVIDQMGLRRDLRRAIINTGMLSDAPRKSQFASARVLDTLPGVPAPLSGRASFQQSSQPVR